jgi:hypothetical protein
LPGTFAVRFAKHPEAKVKRQGGRSRRYRLFRQRRATEKKPLQPSYLNVPEQ